ncbi:MAG: flavin reductase family protein [Candidatus Methanofastidiosa archaeon]|nr:flavin reductase family protein [Candidatus Methanofastidiosa archaeon]
MAKKDLKPYPALFPNPALLVSCGSLERPNIITIAWSSTACLDPPMLTIAVTPSRYSYNLIVESKDFVVNIAEAGDVDKVDLCGNISGSDRDKFAECGYTPEKSKKVSSPRIRECPINIECYLDRTVHLGTHDLFIGQIVNVAVDEGLMGKDMKPDIGRIDTLVYAMGGYFKLGESIGSYGFSLKKGADR